MLKAPKFKKIDLNRNPLGDIAPADGAGRPLSKKALKEEVARAAAASATVWSHIESRRKTS